MPPLPRRSKSQLKLPVERLNPRGDLQE